MKRIISSFKSSSYGPKNFTIVVLCAMTFALILVLNVLLTQFPVLPDFDVFHDVARKWVTGETQLYDSGGRNFFDAPWLMVLLAPLSQLSESTAAAIWVTITLVLIVASLYPFRQDQPTPWYASALALANMPTVYLIFNGQVDAYTLAGVALGWWAIKTHHPWWVGAAFGLMAIKPTHVTLVFLLYLWEIRSWPSRDWLRVLVIPASLVGISGLFLGFDWPLRYINNLYVSPPVDNGTVVLWKLIAQTGIPPIAVGIVALLALAGWIWKVRHDGLTAPTLSIALATTLTFTIYAWNYHYVLLAPALLLLLREHPGWGLLVYLTTLTAAIRMATGGGVFGNEDIIYPASILMAYWGVTLQQWLAAKQNRPSSV